MWKIRGPKICDNLRNLWFFYSLVENNTLSALCISGFFSENRPHPPKKNATLCKISTIEL